MIKQERNIQEEAGITAGDKEIPVEKERRKRGRPKGARNRKQRSGPTKSSNSKFKFSKIACSICHVGFCTLQEKIEHNRMHYGIATLTKTMRFRDSDGLLVPFEVFVDDKGRHRCPHCQACYISAGSFRSHLTRVIGNLSMQEVDGLKKADASLQATKNNAKHTASSPDQNEVKYTDVQMKDQSIDDVHAEGQQMTSLSATETKCTMCQLAFDDNDQLETHCYDFHKSKYFLVAKSNLDESFHFIITRCSDYISCPLCIHKSQSILTLDNHMRTRHRMSVWITQEQPQSHGPIISNEEVQHEDMSYLYQPTFNIDYPNQESSLWQTIKGFFWS